MVLGGGSVSYERGTHVPLALSMGPERARATFISPTEAVSEREVVQGDRLRVERPSVEASGEVPRGEKMLYSRTDPEPYITEYT